MVDLGSTPSHLTIICGLKYPINYNQLCLADGMLQRSNSKPLTVMCGTTHGLIPVAAAKPNVLTDTVSKLFIIS
jgi:hypothetical protein